MARSTIALRLFFTISVLIVLSCSTELPTVSWVPVGRNEILPNSDPVGREHDVDSFLCRAENQGNFYSGKLRPWYTGDDDKRCCIPYYNQELMKANYEMLDYPSGTLSWIPLIDFDDKNAIVAAIIPEIGTNWVCRANLEDKLIPGVYVLGGNCYVPLDDYQHAVSNKSHIEILSINKYGQDLGVQQELLGK